MDEEGTGSNQGLLIAGGLLVAFLVLQWLLPLLPIPKAAVPLGDMLATVLFLGIPLSIAYQAAKARAYPGVLALTFVVAASALVVVLMAQHFGTRANVNPAALVVVGQASVLVSAIALGLMVAMLIKDPNLLLPIAPVLAIVDIVSVLSPVGFTKQIIEKRPEVFHNIAVQVKSFGHAGPIAYMGPADVLFLAMFFAVLHRAGFRARTSFLWMVPTLVLYMLVVYYLGGVRVGPMDLGGLPALVPMGAVILAVNWRCFKLSRQEMTMTGVLLVVAVVLAAVAFTIRSK